MVVICQGGRGYWMVITLGNKQIKTIIIIIIIIIIIALIST